MDGENFALYRYLVEMFPQYGLFLNSSFDLVEAFKGRNIGMTNNENRKSIVTFVLIYQVDFSVMLKVDSEVKFTIRNIMQDHFQYFLFVCLHDCFGLVCFGEGGGGVSMHPFF